MKKLPLDKNSVQEFFTWLAFDNTTSLDDLTIKAENGEEIKLGDFMTNYSHNNSDYSHDELMEKIVKYYTELHDDDFLTLHKHCQAFCELFEGNEGKVFAIDILSEITYVNDKIEYAKMIQMENWICTHEKNAF